MRRVRIPESGVGLMIGVAQHMRNRLGDSNLAVGLHFIVNFEQHLLSNIVCRGGSSESLSYSGSNGQLGMQGNLSLGDIFHDVVDYCQSMSLVEKKLNVVIATCHLCNPFVVIVDPTMVPLDTKNTCIFIEGGLWNDGSGKSGTTFLRAVFEAGRHVFPSMHLTIMDPLCKITRHDDVKVGVIRFCVRLEELSIVIVVFINRVGVLWETFIDNMCDVVKESLAE